MADMKIQGEVVLDTTKADAGFAKVEQTAGRMSAAVKKSADDASKSVDNIGSGSDASATKLDRSTKSMISSIQRVTAQMDAGEKSSSKYFETLANQRGVNVEALRPYLAQLDAAKVKQDAAAESLGGLSNTMKIAAQSFAAIGLGAFVREFATLADASTNVASRLSLVTSSAAELTEVQNNLFASAQASRVGFVDLAGTYAQIARSTKELGISQTSLLGVIDTISQSVTISGGSAASANAALTQLSQGFASGTIRGEELNSVLEQTPRLAQAIAEGLGVGIGQLREMGKAGELTAEAVLGALQNSASSVEQEFNKMAVTIEGASTSAANSVLRLTGAVDKLLGASGAASAGITKLSSAIDFLSSDLEKLGSQGPLREASEEVIGLDNAVKRMKARMEDGVIGPEFQNQLDSLIARLAIAKRNFNELYDASKGLGGASSANYGNEGAREASRQKDIERQSALSSDLNAFRLKQSGVSESYIKDMKEIIRLNQAGVLVGDEYTKALKAQQDTLLKKTEATSRAVKSERATVDEFAVLINKISAKDAGIDASFYKDLNTLYEGYQKGRVGIDEYRTAVENLVQAQSFAKDIHKENAQALETEAKFVALVAEKETKWAAELDKRNQSARSIIDNIQLETSMLGQNDQQRQESIYLRELERLGVEKGTVAYEEYAAAIKSALADQQAQRETIAFWEDLEYTAENVFMDIAMNGEEAFKRIGDSIKEYVLKMLYEITVKRWIIQLSGGNLGTSTSSLLDAGSSLYSAYSTGAAGGAGAGAGAVGGSASAVGSFASGSMSAANTYGSIYANTTGTGINGLLATNGAYGTAGAGGTAGSTTASAVGYLGYAALIAAAVMIANNLYEKGYTRAALGDGGSVTNSAYNSTFTTDANIGNSRVYNDSTERINRSFLDALGVSEKWSDIFSGTTRMATLFGRKLKGYGFDIGIDGGETDVTGYQYYKGGLFRSNKTVQTDIDSRDAELVKQQIDGVQASTRAMAQAMGYSTEAIDNYTGSLKVNFKGAETAEEQSKRMAEAMDDLGVSMLKAASGGTLTKEKFEEFIAGIQESMAEVGVTSEGIADVILAGMTGRLSEADVGAQLSDIVIGGIYDSIAGSYAGQIANVFTSQILTPMFTAIASGVPISQAISQQAIANVVATAKNAAVQLNAILTDPGFQSAISGIQQAISGIAAATGSVSTPSFRRVTTGYNAAADAARAAAEAAARAAQQIKDAWQDVSDAITDEIKRIRGEILGDSEEGRAYYEAQFAIATAAARAGDRDAAAKLPELSQAVLDIADATADSLGDLRAVQAATLASLTDTRQILATKYGLEIPQFAAGGYHTGGLRIVGENGPELEATGPAKYYTADQTASMLGGGDNSELIAEVRALREQVKDLTNISQATAINTKSLDDVTKKVTNGGNATRTIAA